LQTTLQEQLAIITVNRLYIYIYITTSFLCLTLKQTSFWTFNLDLKNKKKKKKKTSTHLIFFSDSLTPTVPHTLLSHSLSLLSSLSVCNTIVSRSIDHCQFANDQGMRTTSWTRSPWTPSMPSSVRSELLWICFLLLLLRSESLWLTIWIFVVWSAIGIRHQQQKGQKNIYMLLVGSWRRQFADFW
jgi:hypothetical protein